MAEAADDGLIAARLLDGEGGGTALDWAGVRSWEPGQGVMWAHLDRAAVEGRAWLEREADLDPLIAEALLAEETRPRVLSVKAGLLVILRGVNLNPGADPEDMVSLRLWTDGHRVITTRARRVMAALDLRDALDNGAGPAGCGAFLVQLAQRLVERLRPVIDALDDGIDDLEERMLADGGRELRLRLHDMRAEAIGLRRYLAPQREALAALQLEDRPWLTGNDKARLREIADRVTRYVEDLDAIRERAAVIQDELMSVLSERMNATMYLLSVVAAIMLPLGFVTGLLGVNVGGIPGSESKWGFAALCLILAVLVAFQVWLFRRKRWL